MKIKNTKRVMDKIEEVMINRDQYNRIMVPVILQINSCGKAIVDPEEFEDISKMFHKELVRIGHNITLEQSMLMQLVIDIAKQVNVSIPDYYIDLMMEESKCLDKSVIYENEYVKNIHFQDAESGKFQLASASFDAYELFDYDIPEYIEYGMGIGKLGFFKEKVEYPCIAEDGHVWMSVTPNEIYAMKPHIDEARGKVLTLGCGMGYYAYMASIKDEVESVTIVEKSQDVIDLFEKHILPQFSHKEKVKIVKADAIEFMNQLEDGVYDVCFADIWIGNNDYIPYLNLKKACKRFNNTKMSYWIEKSILASMQGFVWLEVIHGANDALGLPQMGLPVTGEAEVFVSEMVKEALKDAVIENPEHIDYYLDYRNLPEILGI